MLTHCTKKKVVFFFSSLDLSLASQSQSIKLPHSKLKLSLWDLWWLP